MTITFDVSKVERARALLPDPEEADGGAAPRRVLLGRPVEAWGSNPARSLPVRQHGLLQTVRTAFDRHHPLVLTPDAIWLCIAQGFAAHVNANAERLRGKFVRHEGQAELRVERHDFVKGSPANPWPELFRAFSDQIAAHIGRQRDLVVCDFSTTGPYERAASEVVLLEAMQKYFKYVVVTMCGIPEITLEGTVDDYRSIRRRVQALSEYDLSWWVDRLLPIVDQLIAAAEGRVDVPFWRSLYNLDDSSGGPWVTGWINAFFPYCRHEGAVEPAINDWFRNGRSGLLEADVPPGISVVPFTWEYLGERLPMELLAGFVGMAQDEGTFALRPAIGWAVRSAPRPRKQAVSSPGRRDMEPPSSILLAPSTYTFTGTTLVAGRIAMGSRLSAEVGDIVAEVLHDLRDESGLDLRCYVHDSPGEGASGSDASPPRHGLIVGVALGSVGQPPQISDPLPDPVVALSRLAAVPASVWEQIAQVIPGGLSTEDAIHLVSFASPAALPAGVQATLVLGELTEDHEGEHVCSASRWLHWAVRGVKVAEIRSADSRLRVVDMSPAAVADRIERLDAIGVAVDTAAHHLLVARG